MSAPLMTEPTENNVHHAKWGAVVAMALCASVLISSEFLPMSLLTPIASDLQITEGTAGQSISVSGMFALITSLFIATLIGDRDRKHVVLFFTGLMIVSGLVVTLSPNVAVLMVGRAFLGAAVGGFWSISAAIIMRLVPAKSIPKAIAILMGGNALATTFAAPLGSFLGGLIGWRGAFFCLVPLAGLAMLWQWRSLPSLPATHQGRSVWQVLGLLAQRPVAYGTLACALMFMGQFALFTYLRPFLETVTQVSHDTLTALLLGIGIAGFIGTYLIGILLKTRLYSLLIVFSATMGVIALALICYGVCLPATAGLLLLWGLLATALPAVWWAWLSKTLPHDAEAGGGLLVAIIQLAIMLGAALGGVLYDASGYHCTFSLAAGLLFAGAVMSLLTYVVTHCKKPLREAAN